MYYGASGDCRADLNGSLPSTHDNYMGEDQIAGALIERGRRWAYSLINGKLEPSYPSNVPWTSGNEPELIYEISNLLTQYFVLNKKNLGDDSLDKKKVKALYDEPIKLLDQLASFEMHLPEIESPLGDKVFHTHSERTPVCDMGDIENQRVDPDLLDGIKDARLW